MTSRQTALGEICEFVRGASFDGDESLGSHKDGYVPILRAGNIADELNLSTDLIFVPKSRVSENQLMKPGDIAICMSSGSSAVLGKTAQLRIPFPGSVGAFCGIIRARQSVDSEYVAYWFRSDSFLAWRDTQGRGANIQNLRFSELANIALPLPPLAEQQRIAGLLRRADRLRRLRRYALEVSAGYLQAVFVEMFGDPVRNPMGWEQHPLEHLVRQNDKINYGVVQPGDDYPDGVPIVRVGDFDDIPYTTANLKRIDPKIEAMYARSRLLGDEILIACVGSIGRIALCDKAVQGYNIVRAVARVPVSSRVHRIYLAEYLSTPRVQDYFAKETRTVSQPTLNIEHIKETPVLVPPLQKQQQFVQVAINVERFRSLQREALRQAEHLFQALLRRAFVGERGL